jgi:hypothetical protein
MRIVVDIDDTLFWTTRVNGHYHMKDYNDPLIAKLLWHYEQGDTIILWTGRHWDHLDDTLAQIRASQVKYHALVMGKPPADLYIDDKAVRPDEFLGR